MSSQSIDLGHLMAAASASAALDLTEFDYQSGRKRVPDAEPSEYEDVWRGDPSPPTSASRTTQAAAPTQSISRDLARFIWDICTLLRSTHKCGEFRKVVLPLTLMRRFDCVLTHRENAASAAAPPFRNDSDWTFERLVGDADNLASNLASYIKGFSPNVRAVLDRFEFDAQIERMDRNNQLRLVTERFAGLDLSPERVDNAAMGFVFEELIRIGAEQSLEEAGEHFTPPEVTRLMVGLLLSSQTGSGSGADGWPGSIYDPACGTGGLLWAAERVVRDRDPAAEPLLFGQELNGESWAVCQADMLIRGGDPDSVVHGDTLTGDGFAGRTFDCMVANPPFGVKWADQKKAVQREHDKRGHKGRFGAGLPRITDGSLLFLQHMVSKMAPVGADGAGGSRVAVVFNGSPLFVGDAGSGESEIRRWIITNDLLETIVALPEQLFYNTGIGTYIWIVTNNKEPRRRGKVQLIDGRRFCDKMQRGLNNKRNEITDGHIDDLISIHSSFTDGETRDVTDEHPATHEPRTRSLPVSKIFANEDFGYRKITVERPLRLSFAATPQRVARIEDQTAFAKLATSKQPPGPEHDAEFSAGQARQQTIRDILGTLAEMTQGDLIRDRREFLTKLDTAADTHSTRLSAAETKAVTAALGEPDPDAEICRKPDGDPEPDPRLRDTETVPLTEDIDTYMADEVLPHVADAWADHDKTKTGYEIPLNRHFYVYEPLRPREVVEAEIAELMREIAELVPKVFA